MVRCSIFGCKSDSERKIPRLSFHSQQNPFAIEVNNMPQLFQVLRCYKCLVFQIHQTKKSNKFQCKMCGDKQSIKRHYGIGTSKDCRLHVQKLNHLRGDLDRAKEKFGNVSDEYNCHEEIDEDIIVPKKSKWFEYVTDQEDSSLVKIQNETMYLGNNEVVLEIPKKRKKFNTPIKKEETVEKLNHVSKHPEEIVKNIHSSIMNVPTSIMEDSIEPNCKNYSTSEARTKHPEEIVKNIHSSIMNVPTSIMEDSIEPNCKNYSTSEARTINLAEIPSVHIVINNKNHEVKKDKGNSKWSKYIDSDEENSPDPCNSEHNANSLINLSENTEKNTNTLFSLCDDAELDDILDF